MFHAKDDQRKAGLAIRMSEKVEFKFKTISSDRESQYVMIKESLQQKGITITYALNISVPKYIKQILTYIKTEIDSNTK